MLQELASDGEFLGDPSSVLAGESEFLTSELKGEDQSARVGADLLKVVVIEATNEGMIGGEIVDAKSGESDDAISLFGAVDLPSTELDVLEGIRKGLERGMESDVFHNHASEDFVFEDCTMISAFDLVDSDLDSLRGPVRAIAETGVRDCSITASLGSIEFGLRSVFGLVDVASLASEVLHLSLFYFVFQKRFRSSVE